jgi:hypothetical protein
MPRNSTKGTVQLGAELDAKLVEAFKAFVKQRGESVRFHLEMAMRRHLAFPPPPTEPPPLPPIPPLPPVGTPAPAAPLAPAKTATKGRKAKGK